MKRKRYSYYLTDEEYKNLKEYATEKGRPISEFVRYFALAEVGRHKKEKSVYRRLDAIEKALHPK